MAETESTRSPSTPRRRFNRALRTAGIILGVLWSGYFLHAAYSRWRRWLDVLDFYWPTYPMESKPDFDAIRAGLDWRKPFLVALLPLVLWMAWLIARKLKAHIAAARSRRQQGCRTPPDG